MSSHPASLRCVLLVWPDEGPFAPFSTPSEILAAWWRKRRGCVVDDGQERVAAGPENEMESKI
jgi:hypothetical protein